MTNQSTKSNGVKTLNIHQQFNEWGSSQRVLPQSNNSLKDQVLIKLLPRPVKPASAAFGLPWLSLAFTGLAVIILVLSLQNGNQGSFITNSTTSSSGAMQDLSSADGSQNYATQAAPPAASKKPVTPQSLAMPQGTEINGGGSSENYRLSYLPPDSAAIVPNSDTREFLQTSYSANIRSHNVEELSSRLETTIRGFGGRVDSSNVSADSGYISFVVPADKLDSFKEQVKSIAGAKFYTEQEQSQNMLPEKRSIEDQQKQTSDSIASLTQSRYQLTAAHNQTAASLKAQISSDQKQLASLQGQSITDPGQAIQIQNQEQDLQNRIKVLQSRLADENVSYSNQLNSYNAQIQDAQNSLAQLGKQNSSLLDSVATVQGNISLSYINFWQMLNVYFPLYWFAVIFFAAAIVAFVFYRRNLRIVL